VRSPTGRRRPVYLAPQLVLPVSPLFTTKRCLSNGELTRGEQYSRRRLSVGGALHSISPRLQLVGQREQPRRCLVVEQRERETASARGAYVQFGWYLGWLVHLLRGGRPNACGESQPGINPARFALRCRCGPTFDIKPAHWASLQLQVSVRMHLRSPWGDGGDTTAHVFGRRPQLSAAWRDRWP
jgi:hypothetical protein